ncbi:MAG: amidohydrolase [Linnemannia gamsii]|nr:MAG: amidohydrolase [Linnemannia gamsii]
MLSHSKSGVARRVACAVLALSFAVSVFALPIEEPADSPNSIGHADYKIAEVAAEAKKGSKSSSVLFKGATIIAYDDKKDDLDIIRGGSLLIINDRIADVGKKINTPIPEGTEVVDVTGSIITPGFVDTHKHSWEHIYQSLGPNVLLGEYMYKFSSFAKITTKINPDDSYISTLMSLTDSLNGGVTSVLDHAHGTFTPKHSDAMLKAHIDSGARVWNAYSIIPVPKVKKGKFFLDHAGQEPGGWKWKQLEQLAKDAPWADGRVQLGLESGAYSNIIYQLDQWGYLEKSCPIVFSHGTTSDTNDLEILHRTNNFFSVTPESEHHYDHGQTNTQTFLSQSALGIDTSFTFSSDILSQMRLQLQSTRLRMAQGAHSNFKFVNNTAMTVKQAFLLGTRNGGLAMRRPDIGVIKKGAKADVVVFDTDNAATSAFYDPIAAVVLHSNVGNIEHVLVDGQWVKRDFKLVGLDWKKMKATFAKSARKIQKIWLKLE